MQSHYLSPFVCFAVGVVGVGVTIIGVNQYIYLCP